MQASQTVLDANWNGIMNADWKRVNAVNIIPNWISWIHKQFEVTPPSLSIASTYTQCRAHTHVLTHTKSQLPKVAVARRVTHQHLFIYGCILLCRYKRINSINDAAHRMNTHTHIFRWKQKSTATQFSTNHLHHLSFVRVTSVVYARVCMRDG